MRSSWPLARLQPVSSAAAGPTLTVCFEPEVATAAEAELLGRSDQLAFSDGLRCAFAETADGPAGWFEGIGTFVLDSGRQRVVATRPPAARAGWEHFAVAWALPHLIGLLGASLLHASVVARDGRAWILCAPSGTGKTTTSLALCDAGMELLADDMAVIDAPARRVAAGPRGSRVLIAEGRKALRFSDAARTASLPLAGLALLRARGPGALHRRLAPAAAFVALAPHLCAASEAARARMTHELAGLVRELPVLELRMPDDLAALPAAAAELAEALT